MCAPTNYPSTHLDRLKRVRLTSFYADGRMERGSWQAVKSVQQPDRASIDDLDFGAALMLERDHCPADFFDTQAQVAAVEPNAEAVAEAVASATTLTTTVASSVKCAEALPACLEFGGNAMTGMPNFLTRGWACGMFLLVGILVGMGLRRRSS